MNPTGPRENEKVTYPYSSSHPSQTENGFQSYSSYSAFRSNDSYQNTPQYQAQMAHLAQGYGQSSHQQSYQQPWSDSQSHSTYQSYYASNQYSRDNRDASISTYSSQQNPSYGYYPSHTGETNTTFNAPPTTYTSYNDMVRQYQASQGYPTHQKKEEKAAALVPERDIQQGDQQHAQQYYQHPSSYHQPLPPPTSSSNLYQQTVDTSNYNHQYSQKQYHRATSQSNFLSSAEEFNRNEGNEKLERPKKQSRWDVSNNTQRAGNKPESIEQSNSSGSEDSQYPPSLIEYVNKCVIPHKNDQTKVSSIQEQLRKLINEHKHEIYTFPWHELPVLQPFQNVLNNKNITKGQKQWTGFQNQKKKRGLLSSQLSKECNSELDESLDARGSNVWASGKSNVSKNANKYSQDILMLEKEKEKREKRSKRFSASQSQDTRRMQIDHSEESSLRSYSYSDYSPTKSGKKRKAHQLVGEIEEQKPIVGTCMTLYKEYVRATDIPDPSEIRPSNILQKWLNILKEKWEEETGYKWGVLEIIEKDISPKALSYASIISSSDPEKRKELASHYDFMLSQLKAIRNDMNAQRIRGLLYIDLYETHAKMALQCGDINEFNICQTKLNEAYKENMEGSEKTHFEFLYYRLLYCIFQDLNSVPKIMTSLTKEEKDHLWIRYAWKIRETLATRNYHLFFLLFLRAPGMGKLLIQKFINGERVKALRLILACFRPTVGIEFVTRELGFGEGQIDEDAIQECKDFCSLVGCKFVKENTELDCKNSIVDGSKI